MGSRAFPLRRGVGPRAFPVERGDLLTDPCVYVQSLQSWHGKIVQALAQVSIPKPCRRCASAAPHSKAAVPMQPWIPGGPTNLLEG